MRRESPWWAELYARQHAIWPAWSEREGDAGSVADFLGAGVPAGRVLDLGCGVGRELCALARRGWHGTGLDLSPDLVERARERARRLGVEDRVTFQTADLLEDAPPSDPFDLVLLWDSTLAIWEPAVQQAILRRWSPALASGGHVVVGQLAREHFCTKHEEVATLSGPEIGPGRSERTYDWDAAHEVLLDTVVWFPPAGDPERLPTQRLHLLSVPALARLLEAAGLRDVRLLGAEGWSWIPGRPPDAASCQVVAIGRKP